MNRHSFLMKASLSQESLGRRRGEIVLAFPFVDQSQPLSQETENGVIESSMRTKERVFRGRKGKITIREQRDSSKALSPLHLDRIAAME